MKFAGFVYSGNLRVGFVNSDSLPDLKRQASRKCNAYSFPVDKIVLHRAYDEEINGMTFVRNNRMGLSNAVIRGKWEQKSE
ncbi:MAG: hypothetical protein K2G60_04125 [Oscillospiraceae bacterium]|nr:hypothetical protein [Oscillospiraceae bacterium]